MFSFTVSIPVSYSTGGSGFQLSHWGRLSLRIIFLIPRGKYWNGTIRTSKDCFLSNLFHFMIHTHPTMQHNINLCSWENFMALKKITNITHLIQWDLTFSSRRELRVGSSTLMMEAAYSFETSIPIYQIKQHHVLEDCDINSLNIILHIISIQVTTTLTAIIVKLYLKLCAIMSNSVAKSVVAFAIILFQQLLLSKWK